LDNAQSGGNSAAPDRLGCVWKQPENVAAAYGDDQGCLRMVRRPGPGVVGIVMVAAALLVALFAYIIGGQIP